MPTTEPGTLQDRIARDFRTQIEAGMLTDGEALPPTRALAERLGVSVFTVNQAMKALADEGLIENQSRSRRIVRAPDAVATSVRVQPKTILIGGYAGSGKTELGRILCRLTGWMIIDKDTITRPIVECTLEALGLPPNDRESKTYLTRIRPREYEALMSTAHENAECHAGSMVTAPFLHEFADPAWIDRERSRFADEGVPATLVWVTCDEETMQTYLRRRGAARDTAKLNDWPAYMQTVDLTLRPAVEHVVIDNSLSAEPLRVQAERLVKQLAAAQ